MSRSSWEKSREMSTVFRTRPRIRETSRALGRLWQGKYDVTGIIMNTWMTATKRVTHFEGEKCANGRMIARGGQEK